MPIIERRIEGVRFETTPRRLRVRFGDRFIADSRRAKILLEPGRIPVYYVPQEDVRAEMLVPSARADEQRRGRRLFFHVNHEGRRAPDAAWTFDPPSPEYAFLAGHVGFVWDAMDAWFEEDDEVYVHARDPYKRVDVLRSSRHVAVVLGGETIAETTRPSLLFETELPTRYYIPKADVRLDLLEPSDTRTSCPYKGDAVYWSARIGDTVYPDVVWSYPFPIPECPKIEGLMAFFQERVDAIVVDGEPVEAPVTPWSR